MRPTTLNRRLREHSNGSAKGSKTSVSFKQKGNVAVVKSESPMLRTVDEILSAAGVSEDIWLVTNTEIKKREAPANSLKKDLSWDSEGKMQGWVKSDGTKIKELWSISITLARKSPVALRPTVKPVLCKATYKKLPKKNNGLSKRSLIIADPHFGFSRDVKNAKLDPFHDRGVLDIALQIAEEEQPDGIYIIGDFFDFVMFTDKFLRSPKFEYTTQPAIVEGHWWLRRLRIACPSSSIVIHEGNHDKRVTDSLIKHMRAAYGLKAADRLELPQMMSPASLLALHKLDIKWVDEYPDDATWLNSVLKLEHGSVARSGAGATTRAIVGNSTVSTVFGHIHRKELGSKTIYTHEGQRVIMAYSPGCACRTDGAVPGNTKQQDWHQGIGLIDHTDDGMFSIHDVRVEGGVAIWDRKILVANDIVEDLRSDNPDWNW